MLKIESYQFLNILIFFVIISVNNASDSNNTDEILYLTNYIQEAEAAANNYQLPVNAKEYEPNDTNVIDFGTYDFVIVGSGPGGAVLANRLSEDKSWKVLLIEAGNYGDTITEIPYMYFQIDYTPYNWGFRSIPQTTSCLGMIDSKCPMIRGKGVGGSTLVNGLVYSRGSKIDYDNWAKQVQDKRWSYNEVLPYFRKSENYVHNAKAPVNYTVHGTKGLWNVEYHVPRSPQLDAFLQANLELGYKISDYNADTGLGASPSQLNTIKGRRCDVGTAFILPFLQRDNLKVMTDSYAVKILIDENKNATGLLFTYNNTYYRVKASKEVIISAGAIQTPQLLMLSGIGPKNHLESVGIVSIRDLGVGNTLKDHACYYGINFGTNYTEPILPLEEYVRQYLNGSGPLTVPGNNQGVGFYESKYTKGTGYPDIELMMIPANATSDFSQRDFLLTNKTYEDVWKYTNRTQTYINYIAALHSISVGTVRLKSKDPFEYPLIDNRILSDPKGRDIDVIYEGVQLALKLSRTKAMRAINATLQGHPMRVCKHLNFPSKKYWYCAIRQLTMDLYHPVGTCPMGPDPTKGAVVDSECRIHGIKNLRVVDASVFPFTIAGHPTAPTVMIAERVSDFIKEQYY